MNRLRPIVALAGAAFAALAVATALSGITHPLVAQSCRMPS